VDLAQIARQVNARPQPSRASRRIGSFPVAVATGGNQQRSIERLQTGDESLVARVVRQAQDQHPQGERKADYDPTFVAARPPDAIAQAERHHEIYQVVHQVIELDAIERRRATQSGNLAIDVIEQVPELPEDRTRYPARRPAPAKAHGGRQRDEQGHAGDRMR
jgi:hypothetical protein